MSHAPLHDEHAAPHVEHADLITRNARYGLVLFAFYVALYAGFILLATFSPATLAAPAPGGLNWAILYGFGLIAAALILAVIYMLLCGRDCEVAATSSEDAAE